MKLITCELRKLFSVRATAVFLIILLSSNLVLTYFTARPMPVEAAAREVYGLYLNAPEALADYKQQLEADFYEHLRDDDFEVPSTYTDGADDMSVLHRVFERAEYIKNYRTDTENLADSAEKRARDLVYFGYSEDSFYILEQRRLADTYTDLAGVLDSEDEYAYGYDIYFENTRVCLFILVWLLFAVSFIFRNDRVCGFGGIMRATKGGRLESACAKIAAAVIVGIISTLLFLGTTFVAVGFANGGFSSPFSPVQLLPNYAKVPFEVTMLGYLGIQTGYRLLAAAVFALFAALVASLGFGYVPCFGIGALFAAANYFIFAREYLGTTPPIKYLNLASAAESVELFSFHRDLNFFGKPIPHITVLIAISAVCIVTLSSLCAFFYCKNIRIKIPKITKSGSFTLGLGKKRSKTELRLCPLLPLWVYELKKTGFLPLALIALALLAAHGCYVSASVGNGESYGEAIYYGYISDIKDLPAEERRIYLANERTELESMISNYEPMTDAYERGEMTRDDYGEFLQNYYTAKDREKVLGGVEEYSNYIDRKSASLGIECDLIYNTGYERFFSLGANWFLFAAIVILAVGTFSVEYRSGNCAQIVRAAKKGRKPTFLAKILPYSLIGASLAAIFRAVGLIVTALNYELSDLDAALCSIRAFEAVTVGIGIWQYLIIDILCSMLAGALIASAVCAVSCIFKKTLHNLGAVGVTLALPALLSKTEFALVNLTAPNLVFCSSFGHFTAILLFHALTATAWTLLAARGFVGNLRQCRTNS